AFGKKLPDDSPPACTHRRSNRDLAPSPCRANQQEIRYIRARDEQNEAHCAGQDEQRLSHAAHDGLKNRLHAESDLRETERQLMRSLVLWVARVQLGVGGGQTDARLEK